MPVNIIACPTDNLLEYAYLALAAGQGYLHPHQTTPLIDRNGQNIIAQSKPLPLN